MSIGVRAKHAASVCQMKADSRLGYAAPNYLRVTCEHDRSRSIMS